MSKVPFPQMKKQEPEIPEFNSVVIQLKQASAGAASGFITRFLTQPFDVLKIRFQLQVEPVCSRTPLLANGAKQMPPTSKYTSMMQASRLIYKEEGLMAFWKGHNAGQLLTIIYTVFQFWSYEQIDLKLRHYENLRERKHLRKFLSGGLAGCVGTTISMPFDVIRTRVIGQDPHFKETSIFKLVPSIIEKEGFYGIFRGLGTTLIQIGPLIGFNFMFYHQLNDIYKNVVSTDHHQPPVLWGLVNGCMAGVISKVVVYPLDFIKKRLQLQGFQESRKTFGRNQKCSNIKECVRVTLREEGVMGFYKGMYPTLFKSGLTTALYFSFYDIFKELWVPEVSDD
ncbi:hypothetical protein FF38_03247 [Lucilia cuprina]|uniref:Mitochondrial thiamine pyrophosphate carrier n=1 Tax=Lucilia cuprina TaxID=7375 RepID=A0A0L0BP63_LUCCU|nr:Mitochondrial thiamine pyrophosphate carrier [Lucilia cuprina]KNC21852.1 hypothetical protein FF38_03247 [Lucilia cuprina]